MTIFKLALQKCFSLRINIMVTFLFPISLVFIPNNFGFSLFGLASLYSAFLFCRNIIEDRTNKTIIRIASSPISYRQYLSSHLLAYLLILVIQSFILIIINFIVKSGPIVDYLLIFSLYFVFSIMGISFSLFWNSFFKQYNISMAVYSGVVSVMCVISGISMPYHIFPEKLQKIIMIFPTHWLPYGLNGIFHDKIKDVIIAHIVLLIFSGIFFLIGSKRRF